MILCARNAVCLSLVMIVASACGMVREEPSRSADNQQNWFEYAYYSSAADETLDAGALKASRMRLP